MREQFKDGSDSVREARKRKALGPMDGIASNMYRYMQYV